MKFYLRSKCILRLFLPLCFLIGIIYGPIIYRMTKFGYDYLVHMGLAVKMMTTATLVAPHFLFHLAVVVASFFSPETVPAATVFVLVLAMLATAIIVAQTLDNECSTPYLTIMLTSALLIVAPVAILAPFDSHLYFGYISPTVFHNPTILLLKPLALLSFGLILKAFENRNDSDLIVLIACVITTIVCVLTKPSFTICILPASVLLFMYRMMRKDTPDWKLLLFGLVIPALVTLAFQFNITYGAEQLPGVYEGQSGIVFAPLIVMEKYSSWLLPKLLLSLLFPLAVLFSDFRAALKDTRLQLSWLAFLSGAAYTYLLAESGPRMFQGNFGWSAQITLFILFVNSAVYMFHKYNHSRESSAFPIRRKWYLCNAALLLHTIFGAVFYLSELLQTERYW